MKKTTKTKPNPRSKKKAAAKPRFFDRFKPLLTKKRVLIPLIVALAVGGVGAYVYQSSRAATNTHYPYMFPQGGQTPGSCSRTTLQQGSRGSCVVVLQNQLNIWRYKIGGTVGSDYINGDGVFGSVTRSRVVAFQQYMGIKADGVVGPSQTWPKLMLVSSTSPGQWVKGNNGTTVTNNSSVGGIVCSRAYFSGQTSANIIGGRTAKITGAFKNTATSRITANVELRVTQGSSLKSSTVQRWSLAGAENKSVGFDTKSLAVGSYLARFYIDGKQSTGCSLTFSVK